MTVILYNIWAEGFLDHDRATGRALRKGRARWLGCERAESFGGAVMAWVARDLSRVDLLDVRGPTEIYYDGRRLHDNEKGARANHG